MDLQSVGVDISVYLDFVALVFSSFNFLLW